MAALLQEHSLEEVLNIVCTEAISLTNSSGCTISLVEADGWLKPAFSLGEGPFSFDNAPIASPLLEMTLNTSQLGFTLEEDQGCLLVVPLRDKGKIMGALTISHKYRQFSDEDLLIMSRFADPAAIAIENARLYQQLERVAIIEERNRLARELHDSVTQSLYAVTLYAEAATRLLSSGDLAGANDNLKALSQTAQEAVKEMRLLIFELRPPVLEKEGLVAAIQARLEAVEGRAGLKTELVVNLHDRLTPEIEETYYRIIQEALNNILKHSQAQKVSVTLIQESNSVILEIIDDGVGFDLASASERGGFGLKSMSERAEKYNCQLKISSETGKGTRIHVETRL
jgi:signal transduction histidine kinase